MPMSWHDELRQLHQQRVDSQLYRTRHALQSPQGRAVSIDGRSLLNFSSNDYLGLAFHPALVAASRAACEKWGTGSGAAHLVSGHLELHHRLEEKIARQVGAQQALLFSTGYMANLAIPQAFLKRGDLIFQDKLNHASLIDAATLSPATLKRYHHLDIGSLNKRLQSASPTARKLISTDSVFSMDGDIAPLNELFTTCQQHDALLVVDEAHGFGVLGEHGNGALEAAGLAPGGNVLMVGTLGKAMGSFGAFVAGDATLIEHLIQFSRSYIFTTALPPHVVAATDAALDLLKSEPELRQRLHANVTSFRQLLADKDRDGQVCPRLLESRTPIQPILVGAASAAIEASQRLLGQGLLVSAIRPPTVPPNGSRLRITLTADHTFADLDRLTTELCQTDFIQLLQVSD